MHSSVEQSDPDAAFLRRQRIARAMTAAWLLVSLWRIPPVPTRWPALAQIGMWLMILGTIPVFAALVWSARCTLCGGGIKLNGHTCNQCGHDFPSHTFQSQPSTPRKSA